MNYFCKIIDKTMKLGKKMGWNWDGLFYKFVLYTYIIVDYNFVQYSVPHLWLVRLFTMSEMGMKQTYIYI